MLNETYHMIINTAYPTPFVPKNNDIKTNDKFVTKENNKKFNKNNNDKFISFQTTKQPSESTPTSTNTLTMTVTESNIKNNNIQVILSMIAFMLVIKALKNKFIIVILKMI